MSRTRIIEITICVLFWACIAQIVWWMADRSPPFMLDSYTVDPTKRGHVALITGKVRRDIHRGCSATFARYIFDSQGFRHALGNEEAMSAAGIKRMDAINPGVLRLAIPLPESMAAGPARYVTDLVYSCNPIHVFKPIHVLMEIPIEVLQ